MRRMEKYFLVKRVSPFVYCSGLTTGNADRIKDFAYSQAMFDPEEGFPQQSCRMKCFGHKLCAWSSYVVPKR
jgi:hypothetical protein